MSKREKSDPARTPPVDNRFVAEGDEQFGPALTDADAQADRDGTPRPSRSASTPEGDVPAAPAPVFVPQVGPPVGMLERRRGRSDTRLHPQTNRRGIVEGGYVGVERRGGMPDSRPDPRAERRAISRNPANPGNQRKLGNPNETRNPRNTGNASDPSGTRDS